MFNNKDIAVFLTYAWIIIWFAAVLFVSDAKDVQLKTIEFSKIGDFLAGLFAPIALVWFYMGYTLQGEELKQAVDEYKNMVKIQNMKYRPRFEVIQNSNSSFGSSSVNGGENTFMYILRLNNIGATMYNFSARLVEGSNISFISYDREMRIKEGNVIEIALQFIERFESPVFDNGISNIVPNNTLFSINYDTTVEDNISETFQLQISLERGQLWSYMIKPKTVQASLSQG